MEEYIRLEEEKAQRHGRTFNWQTATFGKLKYYEDKDDCFTDFETEFPVILFDNTLTPDIALLCEPRTFWMSDTEMGLDVADTLCFQLGGVRRRMTGQAPEKVTGVDLFYLRSMDRGTANVPHLLAQYLFRHAEGRKSGARLYGGHFVRCLAVHFGLVSDEGLRGLSVVTREHPLVDLHELGRLNICSRYRDTWAWVAPGPERQQAATAGAHEAGEGGPTVDEDDQDVPALVQAP
ncbi:hypothetical protein Tco_0755605 [Tanacetum coccineum]